MPNASACRFCGTRFLGEPLLSYPNAPLSAQGFLESLDHVDDVVELDIYQCISCGLVQHRLPPVSYYRDVIRAVAYSPEMGAFRIGQLGDWVQKYGLSSKRILEIGSGRGEYLDLLQIAGAKQVFGIENSCASVATAKSRGFDVRHGYLSAGFENPWRSELFDAFAIFSFMEHWPDLNGSLRVLQNILVDGAVGLVEVPNFEFILANGLYSEFTTDHIYYFDHQSLRTVLECNGFEVVSIKSVWHDYILSAQVKKRSLIKADGFKEKQAKIVGELHSFTDRFTRNQVVVWGAGHQALAVIALANLQSRVSHVVDSATFKQYKYTPGSHLLIKSPDSLTQDRPDAIIVMAAAYSDEVARAVADLYPSIAHVAILREDQVEIVKNAE